MSWRDFFYYSKGERRGLIVLLCLIATAGILLILDNKSSKSDDTKSEQNIVNTNTQSENSNNNQKISSQSEQNKYSKEPSSTRQNTKSNTNSSSTSKTNEIIEAERSSTESFVASDNEKNEPSEKKESVSERVERLTSYARPSYPRSEKFTEGTVVELNTADTTILKKVPGIGSTFAKRIVSYRTLLGGFYSVTQLSEVYGIDEERYNSLEQWFSANPELISTIKVNTISQDSLNRHPYINYSQSRVITQLKKQKGSLTGWENLQLLNEFTDADMIRLKHYLSFE